jgi:glycine oxidase
MAQIVVVGAGAIGQASAYRLAQAGHCVRVVDSSGTRGASWAAAGMLAPVSEASFGEAALTRLTVAAVADFVELADELADELAGTASGDTAELDVGLRREGTLVVAFNADDKAALDRLSEYRSSLGLATTRLTGSAVRAHEPYLASTVRAGVLAEDDLSVDNRRYLGVLTAAGERAGVQTIAGTVQELVRSGDRVRGVRLDSGAELACDVVVLCAGARSQQLLQLGVQPVKGQIIRLSVPGRLGVVLTRTVRGLVRGSEVYLVPRAGGELVVGATSEQQGYDTAVTAGGVYELLRNAYELLPISSEFEFVEARAGSRPGTADNGPLVGEYEPGLLIATGHYRNGILLSAMTARAVTALVAGQPLAPEWEPFGARRFTD